MNPGKAFEREFRRSLTAAAERAGGVSFRLYDGQGKAADEPVLADFLMFTEVGAYAFECKETQERSWPFRKLRDAQADALTSFANVNRSNRAYVAVNFRRPGTLNEMYLMPINSLLRHRDECGRASLTREAAAMIGIRCQRVGSEWELPDIFGGGAE